MRDTSGTSSRPWWRRISWRTAAAYVLYTTVALVAFVVWLFPIEAVQTRIMDEIRIRTGAIVTVDERTWIFPLGFEWRNVGIVPRGRSEQPLHLDLVRARVAILPLVSRRMEVDLVWEGYGGRSRGSVVLRPEGSDVQISMDQFGKDFDLSKVSEIPVGSWSGTLQAEVNARWVNEGWWLGDGAGSVEVTNVKVDGLIVNGLPVNGIEFDVVNGQVALAGGTLTVNRLAGRGRLGTVEGDGTILVRSSWPDSIVNLTITLKPSELARTRWPMLALTGNNVSSVTLRLSGRLGRPNISVNGIPVA